MLSEKTNKITAKINSIQDNISSQNIAINSAFTPIKEQNSYNGFSPIGNYCFPHLINNNTKEDSYSQTQINSMQNNNTIPASNSISKIKFKIKNVINNSSNTCDDPSSEKKITNKTHLRINQAKNKANQNIKVKKKKEFKKFKICHIEYPKNPNDIGKSLNKLKHKRKYKPDDIRKKIKARFHKSIKNIINDNLRKAGSKKMFTFLPQVFISSISREKNRRVLNLTFRELLQSNFVNDIDEKKYKNRNVDYAKYKKNLSVLEYLDKNPEICKKSGFDLIGKMKYCDLLNEYFQSDEFERAIFKLREENEDEDYIREYMNKSKNYVKFFMDIPFKIKPDKFKTTSEHINNLENNKKPIEVIINK
jgi:hypothetical protein